MLGGEGGYFTLTSLEVVTYYPGFTDGESSTKTCYVICHSLNVAVTSNCRTMLILNTKLIIEM